MSGVRIFMGRAHIHATSADGKPFSHLAVFVAIEPNGWVTFNVEGQEAREAMPPHRVERIVSIAAAPSTPASAFPEARDEH